jgi:hypothetical protein
MTKQNTQSNTKTMMGKGGLMPGSDLPDLDNPEQDELDDPRNTHYEMTEARFRQPVQKSTNPNSSVAGFLQPSGGGISNGRPNGQISAGGSFSKVKDPEDSIHPRLSA